MANHYVIRVKSTNFTHKSKRIMNKPHEHTSFSVKSFKIGIGDLAKS